MSVPIRLDRKLVEAAAAESALHHRTTPKQIEHWADLGRRLAGRISAADAQAISQGLLQLNLEPAPAPTVSGADLLAQIRADRASGELSDRVTGAAVRYQQHPEHPGYLEAVYTDGRRVCGRFQDGEFVPQSPDGRLGV